MYGLDNCNIKPEILIVDDHDTLRTCVRNWIRISFPKAQIMEANNGEEAVSLVRSRAFDIILMDVRMHKMNGLDATREIKSIQPSAHVIIITAHNSSEYKATAKSAGASAFVLKSQINTDLIPILNDILSSESR